MTVVKTLWLIRVSFNKVATGKVMACLTALIIIGDLVNNFDKYRWGDRTMPSAVWPVAAGCSTFFTGRRIFVILLLERHSVINSTSLLYFYHVLFNHVLSNKRPRQQRHQRKTKLGGGRERQQPTLVNVDTFKTPQYFLAHNEDEGKWRCLPHHSPHCPAFTLLPSSFSD